MRTKLREEERKVLETRPHWITVIKPILVFCFATFLLGLSFIAIKTVEGFGLLARWICGIIWIFAFIYLVYCEWFRRKDIWAVTNLRVIDEKGVFSLYSKESPLDKINNLSYKQSILGRLLNYGEVEIQTAAEDGATVYRKVLRPKLLKETIAHCREEYGQMQRTIRRELPEEQGKMTRVCPMCGETIKAGAKVCRFCGRDLPPV